MTILNVLANYLDSQYKSIISQIRELRYGVRRLENRTKVYMYIDVTSIGLTAATTTCRAVKNNMNLNSKLVLAVAGGNYPILDTPVRADSGAGTQSGTIVFEANQLSPNRFTCWFYNENGNWYRYFNDAYPSTDARYDSGWLWVQNAGMQQQISTADLASKYGGRLSNIREPGEYFLAGSTVNTALDSPYGSSGSPAIDLVVKRMQLDRGIIQTIRDNVGTQTGYRQSITSAGTVGGWLQEVVQGTALGFDMLTQHLTPKTASLYNLGGGSQRWNNIYLVNNPNVSSDARLKCGVESISQELIDLVANTPLVKYNLNEDVAGTNRYGIIITPELYERVQELGGTGLLFESTEDGLYSACYTEWQNVLLEGMRREFVQRSSQSEVPSE